LRPAGTDDEFAHFRVDAVGADHEIGFGPRSIPEFETDDIAGIIQRAQPLVELQVSAVSIDVHLRLTKASGCSPMADNACSIPSRRITSMTFELK